jgi:uncharacterized repeat protein (TIGR03803 family)
MRYLRKLVLVQRALLVVALCVGARQATAQNFAVLHRFDGTDGSGPNAPLVEGFDGMLYGVTDAGGAIGGGTIFKIGISGAFYSIYSFCISSTECLTGGQPQSLSIDQNGYYNGVAFGGGSNGGGTVFNMTPGGTVTTLYNFCLQNSCIGGAEPLTSAQSADGSIYGITRGSGTHNAGIVFKIAGANKLSMVYKFCALYGCVDGEYPSSLIQSTDGNFYGTTTAGGANHYYGSVFKLTPAGVLTVLHSFCSEANCADGESPNHLIQAADGNFYGTTPSEIFEITPDGVFTVLSTLSAGTAEGLIQATDGNLYGSICALYSAAPNTIFRLGPDGTVETVFNFAATNAGTCPRGLMQATNGMLYGVAEHGGQPGNEGVFGTVFRLNLGLKPFIKTVLTSGAVGARVTIIGRNLTGASSVSFNGTPAVYTVSSSGIEIVTSVPAGATSGPVTVTTPSGSLTSNVVFTVLP